MKTLACLVLAGLTGFAIPLHAQQAPPTEKPNPVTEKRFDLKVEGLTIDDLGGLIEASLGHPINLIVPPAASGTMLPSMKLRQVTVPELFEALQTASAPGIESGPAYTFEMTSGNIWIFRVLLPQPAPAMAVTPPISHIFSLEPYLANLKIEDIITAVQTAWKMAGGGETPNVKFHEETKLLIASGAQDQLQVIDNVLNALKTTVQSKSEAALAANLNRAKEELQSQLITSGLRIEALENANAKLQKQNAQLEEALTQLRVELGARNSAPPSKN